MTASLEQFANLAQTTLSGNITAGATSLTVAANTGFPSTGNFRIIIDNEIFIVTAVSGTTFTVTPGAEGTTQANHTSGATITHILTKGALAAGFQLAPVEPAGRLTLVSNTPVMNANATLQGTIYYCGQNGDFYPVFNGTSWGTYPLDTQLSLTLDSNSGHTGYQASGSLFGIYATLNNGSPILCTGPAGFVPSQVSLFNGIWTNNSSMIAKIDSTATTITVPANQATLLGVMYATANGQTGFNPWPSAAAGGSAPFVAIANVYNQIPITARCIDSTTSYTYSTNTWRSADGSTSNRISYVDPLGAFNVSASYKQVAASAVANNFFEIGINLNSTSATPANIGYSVSGSTTLANNYKEAFVTDQFAPTSGYNYLQAMENNSAISTTYNPVSGCATLTANLWY